ncbi:MAG TPA: 50S ribosomal protein L9 [Candidatus Paceibacterota bacterium]|nr:50S ribosomal protein L9 [Candidatus Paceibacterota bacterium]
MKVILLKDVPRYGQKHTIKDAKDGYALNFLIPQGLAVIATPEVLEKMKADDSARLAAQKAEDAVLVGVIRTLQKEPPVLHVATNEKGSLFKAIHVKEIAEQIVVQTGKKIPESALKLEKPIKEAGDHKVEVKIGDETLIFKVNIVKQ